ncbi:hypothetical protein LTR62_008674 [Meristemomyces frigidus]|uniref:S-adenosyl-L-methionine-dependent methyltransferase n=1 Tax=Meristemomyces frigidus TaxID=1508187 RepID=A0AAN7TKP9_9PEZI|nr:hypothetical protein LTR62_008674 [Meristemomyces frigidus]
MDPRDKEQTADTPAPSVTAENAPPSATSHVKQSIETLPRQSVEHPEESKDGQAPQMAASETEERHPPMLKAEASVPGSIDAASIATSATPAPADVHEERPDDTEFIQHPVQDAQLAEEQELEPEDDDDSAIGSDTQSLTTTLTYKDGKYIFPNDEREADRLDLQHHLFQITFGNRLYFAPLGPVRRAIDIGTGTGIWAVDFADAHPEAEVIGVDLSPGQPTLVPPNLKFIIDDAEDLWIYDQTFDYIHARLMAGCFADWPGFFRQAYQNLEPGGWLELQDYGLPVKSADNTHLGTDLHRWGELLCHAARNLGRPMGSDASENYETWMRAAGFVDIEQRMFMWPSNSWPRDPYMKELGRWNQVNILEGLEGFCLALLTRGLGWTKMEVDVFVARVGRDLKDRRIHAYFPMPVTFGRKPFPGEVV